MSTEHQQPERAAPQRRADRSSHQSPAPSGAPAPRTLGQRRIAHVQAALGNQAAARAAARLQRDEAAAGSSDAEFEALLRQIGAWAPPVPPFEAIASTTPAEYSRGELERAIVRRWQRQRIPFTQAARESAAAPHTAGHPHAMQSAGLGRDTAYAQRWALSIMCANYQHGADLGDVARLARDGSPFRSALEGEFSRTDLASDPAGSEIDARILASVIALGGALRPGQLGELLVTFSGHGTSGAMVGVDGAVVTAPRMRALAEIAAGWHVHIVYVIDTCRSGSLVGNAQLAELGHLRGQLGQIPAGQREVAAALIALTGRLREASRDVGVYTLAVADRQRDLRREPDQKERPARRADLGLAIAQAAEKLAALQRLLGERDALQHDIPRRADLLRMAQAAEQAAFAGLPSLQIGAYVRAVAPLFDAASDSINALIQRVSGMIGR